jgi:K+-sensing histidine kinase KdpD
MLQVSDTKRFTQPRLAPRSVSGAGTRNPTAAYGVALAAVSCAVVMRVLLQHTLGDQFLFIPLLAAIAVAAYYGGHGPALTALLVGATAITAVIPFARHAFVSGDPAYQLGLVLYGLAGYSCIVAIDSLRVERDSARRACAEKERLVEEREGLGRDPRERDEMLQAAVVVGPDQLRSNAAEVALLRDPVPQAPGRQAETAQDIPSEQHVARPMRARRAMHTATGELLRRRRGGQRRRQAHRHRHRR